MGPAAAPAGRGHHSEPYGAMAQLGDQLEAQDPHGNWLGASVAGERGHGDERELLVHYNGWNKRHDEWLVVGGGRLQAAGDELSPERALVRSPAREAGVQRKAACGAAASLALALLPPLGREAEGNGHRAKKQPANGFTPEEDAAIRKGVLKHGTGKWKEILEDRELAVLKHKSRTSDAIRLRYTRNILPDETQEAEAPQKSREAGVQGKPAPGLQLWRSGKNATGYVGVTCKDEKSTKRYCAKAPIVNGEGLYLGRFATALEAATAFAQHVQGLDEGWQQSRQLQNAWVEQHPGEGEEGKGGAKGEGGKGAKKGKGSKTAKRAEKEEVQGGGSDSSDEDEHGGSPAVRLVQSKSGADEYEAAPTVTRAAGLELHLSAKSNTGYQGVSWKKNQNDGNGQKRFYVTLKGSHLGCFPSAVEAAAAYAAHLQSERKPPAPAEQAQAKIRATPAVAPAPRAAATTKAAARRPISSAPAAANTTRKQAEAVSYPAAAPLGAAGRLSSYGGAGKEIEGGGGFARMAGVAAAPEAQANLRGWLARSKLDMYGDGLEELGYDDLDYLLQLPKETLAEVAEEVSMKPGHKRKFVDYAMQHSSDSCHDLPPKMTLATCAGSVVHEAGSFAIGDFVTAAYFVEKDKQLPAGTHESHRGRHYSGRIVGIDRAHDSFTVAYDDGDTEQDVQRASLRVVE